MSDIVYKFAVGEKVFDTQMGKNTVIRDRCCNIKNGKIYSIEPYNLSDYTGWVIESNLSKI